MRSRPYISVQAARRFLVVVIAFEMFLVAVFLADGILGEPSLTFHKLFDLDDEKNIPALFSSAQLFLVGIVFLSMAYQPRQLHFSSPRFLAVLGMAFIFLSFDEAISIHEQITKSLVHIEWIPRFRGNHGIWVAPYLFVGLVFFLLTYKELLTMWRNSRREITIMVLGFAIFLLGVVVMEVISFQFLREEGTSPYLYQLEVAIEEFLEMMGISIVLYGAVLLSLAQSERSMPVNKA